MVVYAWNESSENGFTVIPSKGNGTIFIDTLAKILPAKC